MSFVKEEIERYGFRRWLVAMIRRPGLAPSTRRGIWNVAFIEYLLQCNEMMHWSRDE